MFTKTSLPANNSWQHSNGTSLNIMFCYRSPSQHKQTKTLIALLLLSSLWRCEISSNPLNLDGFNANSQHPTLTGSLYPSNMPLCNDSTPSCHLDNQLVLKDSITAEPIIWIALLIGLFWFIAYHNALHIRRPSLTNPSMRYSPPSIQQLFCSYQK